MTTPQERASADVAASLDQLLVDAATGPLRRFAPDASTAKFLAKLAGDPVATGRELGRLAMELGRVVAGDSDLAPTRRDRRFVDKAWSGNPFLRRLVQSYLASAQAAEGLVAVADLGWRDDRRVRFLVENLVEALSPSNVALVNPASAKEAIDSGGGSLLRGAGQFLRDLRSPPRIPEMVDTSGFTVGENIAVSPGAVVLRTEVLELIQYRPQTEQVREVPLLIVPPTINKFYAIDLAKGRSLVEYLVGAGQQVFVISWRNPDVRHRDWGMETYVAAVREAMEAVERVTRSDRLLLTGICAGGIIASITAAVLAGKGELGRLAGFTTFVTVLDSTRGGDTAALVDRTSAAAAIAMSKRRGYLDGRSLAEVFAWLRPGDLIWNYWVNNYLLGRRPPAFDILFWNADTTRMSARLHADFVDIATENRFAHPGSFSVDGVPIDMSTVDVGAYVIAGIADHITPWQNCYLTTQLLGGDAKFVLSTSGHIAALVNPPTNPKATYQLNKANPLDAEEWLRGATTEQGSWWPDWAAWLGERAGQQKKAPTELGGGGLTPLVDAPGTYVFDT